MPNRNSHYDRCNNNNDYPDYLMFIWHFLIHFYNHHKPKSFRFHARPISSHILYLCQNLERLKILHRTSRIFRDRTKRVYLAFFCSLFCQEIVNPVLLGYVFIWQIFICRWNKLSTPKRVIVGKKWGKRAMLIWPFFFHEY